MFDIQVLCHLHYWRAALTSHLLFEKYHCHGKHLYHLCSRQKEAFQNLRLLFDRQAKVLVLEDKLPAGIC